MLVTWRYISTCEKISLTSEKDRDRLREKERESERKTEIETETYRDRDYLSILLKELLLLLA